MHICSLEIEGDDWVNLEEVISDYKGVTFVFDPTKTYRIQNISNINIQVVESESELAYNYNEGEVLLPYEKYEYVPLVDDKLYIRGNGEPLIIDIFEVNGGTIQNIDNSINDINNTIGDLNDDLSEI